MSGGVFLLYVLYCYQMADLIRPEIGSLWRLLFRESDRLPAGSIGAVVDLSDKAGEVELIFPGDRITFNLGEFNERCQQPAPEPSIGELAEAHEILGHDAIELAHDIWCRDSHMDRALAAQGTTRAMLLVAYPSLRKKILADLQPQERLQDLIEQGRSAYKYWANCDKCGQEMGVNMVGMGRCCHCGYDRNPFKDTRV